jgi:predicted DNA-binding transcriptional regulator YafY
MPKPADISDSLGWAVAARLLFLEERAWYTDRINRSDLVDHFGISEQQASGDLTRYQDLAPGNLVYDKSAKTYRTTPEFQPILFNPDPAGTLGRLRLVAEGILERDELSAALDVDVAVTPTRPVAPDILRTVLRAIGERRQMTAAYVSFRSTQGRMRTLEPHALAYDGFRWHARARDVEANAFRDYVLGRLSGPELGNPSEVSPLEDTDWQNRVTLTIAANPRLSEDQKRIIERDYGMQDGRAEIATRRALLFYTKLRLGLDLDPDARRPEDQHIVLIDERPDSET